MLEGRNLDVNVLRRLLFLAEDLSTGGEPPRHVPRGDPGSHGDPSLGFIGRKEDERTRNPNEISLLSLFRKVTRRKGCRNPVTGEACEELVDE